MFKTNLILGLFIFLVPCTIFLIYKSQSIKRFYKKELIKRLAQDAASRSDILTENDIIHLPEPVQKYLRYVNAVGREKVRSFKVICDGEIKMDPKQAWFKAETKQYNCFKDEARFLYIKGKLFGIPTEGLDSYLNCKGNMVIKVASLFKVADAKGEEFDYSLMISLFNDMCLLAPPALIDERISWETINANTVKGTFQNNGSTVSALLYFNDKGELINFITNDRYLSATGKTPVKVKWSSPVRDYKDINGIKVPVCGEVIWHLKDEDFCYAKYKIKHIEYNFKQL